MPSTAFSYLLISGANLDKPEQNFIFARKSACDSKLLFFALLEQAILKKIKCQSLAKLNRLYTFC